MHSNRSEAVDSLSAGDIGVAIGLKFSQTGDTLGTDKFPIILEKWISPNLLFQIAIEPKSISEGDKLKDVIEILSKEDPTFKMKENEDTGQLIISGMGELHLEVLVTRMLKEFNVDANVGNPQVSYRESITAEHRHVEKFHKVIAGNENNAELTISVKPASRGEGNSVNLDKIVKKLPKEILAAVERGISGSFNAGIQMGYPVVDTAITVEDAVYSEINSSEFAFEAAASMGFDSVCRNASLFFLNRL